MTTLRTWTGRGLLAALLAGGPAACDFIESTATNPNQVPTATTDQLFTGIQLNAFFLNESILARLGAVWLNQMSGVDRQFLAYGRYDQITEQLGDEPFNTIYTGGGMIDIREAIELTDNRVYHGVLKIHEAFLVGMAASVFGAIPYSEAANPDIAEPAVDDQSAVYAAVQSLLDEAIADLTSGEAAPVSLEDGDLNFAGNPASWIAVAHSLKARLHMHWAEAAPGATPGNPSPDLSRYSQALAEGQLGIASAAGNWRTVHSASSPENNLWFQFQRDRINYIRGGEYQVNLLDVNGNFVFDDGVDDPRLPIYYKTNASRFVSSQICGTNPTACTPTGDTVRANTVYVGAPVGGGGVGTNASDLNVVGGPAYGQPILTCSETQFIIAEAEFFVGTEANARTALQAGLDCEKEYWGIDLPDVNLLLAGPALLEEILHQKYIANFLNMEVYNDYKRLCLPAVPTYDPGTGPLEIPRRLFISDNERATNDNVDPAGTGRNGLANENDPGDGCVPGFP